MSEIRQFACDRCGKGPIPQATPAGKDVHGVIITGEINDITGSGWHRLVETRDRRTEDFTLCVGCFLTELNLSVPDVRAWLKDRTKSTLGPPR